MIGEAFPDPVQHFRLRRVEECDSTNSVCIELAQAGEAGNLWVLAKKQTAGRGSRGRSWTSEPNNFFASLLLDDPADVTHLANLTFVASVALRRALVGFAGIHADITLKWPNDVLLNGKKCSGILLESGKGHAGPIVVVGIGVNCVSSPEGTLHAATSLLAEGIEIAPEVLMSVLSAEMADVLSIWDRGRGFEAIRQEWLAVAAGIGQSATVRIPGNEDKRGIFVSIDESGYMLLQTSANTTERISAADVFFT